MTIQAVTEWFDYLVRELPPCRKTRLRFYRIPDEDMAPGYIYEDTKGLVLALQILDCIQCMAKWLCHEYAHILDWKVSKKCGDHHGDSFGMYLAKVEDLFYRSNKDK
jgi:hypothetical protein